MGRYEQMFLKQNTLHYENQHVLSVFTTTVNTPIVLVTSFIFNMLRIWHIWKIFLIGKKIPLCYSELLPLVPWPVCLNTQSSVNGAALGLGILTKSKFMLVSDSGLSSLYLVSRESHHRDHWPHKPTCLPRHPGLYTFYHIPLQTLQFSNITYYASLPISHFTNHLLHRVEFYLLHQPLQFPCFPHHDQLFLFTPEAASATVEDFITYTVSQRKCFHS